MGNNPMPISAGSVKLDEKNRKKAGLGDGFFLIKLKFAGPIMPIQLSIDSVN
jgi:hypothetical protein